MTGLSSADLGEKSFSELLPNADFVSLEVSRNLTFYLESTEINFGGGYFLTSYVGWVGHAAVLGKTDVEVVSKKLRRLYDAQILGEDTVASVGAVRQTLYPNMFGFGELPIETIQQGLLTQAEQNYFD